MAAHTALEFRYGRDILGKRRSEELCMLPFRQPLDTDMRKRASASSTSVVGLELNSQAAGFADRLSRLGIQDRAAQSPKLA